MHSQNLPERPAVVVTGGSSGIGAELCRRAAHRGWHVWIGYAAGANRAEQLATDLQYKGCSATAISLPLHDPDKLRAGIAVIASHPSDAQALVLCGSPPPDVVSLLKLAPEQIRHQLECGVVGNHVLLTEFWRHCLRRRGGGHVIAVLTAALGPPAAAYMAGYIAAKGGLAALLEAAATELGRAGLRISALRPGYVETPMLEVFQPLLLERARALAPGQRFLTPDDIALVILQALESPPPPGIVAELDIATSPTLEAERV